MWYSHRKILTLLLVSVGCCAIAIGAGTKKKKPEPTRSTIVEEAPRSTKAKPVQQQATVTNSEIQLKTPLITRVTGVAIGELIRKQVLTSGGGVAVSVNYVASQATGQTIIGNSCSVNYCSDQGFMASGSHSCCRNRGNVDDIIGPGGPVDVSDLTYIVAFLFKGGPEPPCIEQGNVDSIVGPGGPIDVSDLTYLVAYLFKGGPIPPSC